MTHETKLGLIIGGLFIVCFALLLGSMEHEPALEQQISTFRQLSQQTPGGLELADDGRLSPQLVGYVPPAVKNKTRSPQPGGSPAPAATITDAALENRAPSPSRQRVVAQPDSPADIKLRQSPPPHDLPQNPLVADAIANRPLVPSADGIRRDPHTVHRPKTSSRPLNTTVEEVSRATVKKPASGSPTRRGPRKVQIYTVAPKDNLTRIAKRFYGQADDNNIEQIFQANRRTLQNRHRLQVGQELRIPLEPQATGVEPSADRSSGAAPAAVPKWSWYQVRKGDRYSKIAQAQLGNGARWREIYELNKTRFPDPDRIRPGVRIKIPKR